MIEWGLSYFHSLLSNCRTRLISEKIYLIREITNSHNLIVNLFIILWFIKEYLFFIFEQKLDSLIMFHFFQFQSKVIIIWRIYVIFTLLLFLSWSFSQCVFQLSSLFEILSYCHCHNVNYSHASKLNFIKRILREITILYLLWLYLLISLSTVRFDKLFERLLLYLLL